MDALEFFKERKRMCKSFRYSCDGCPLQGGPCTDINRMNDSDLERIVVKVEQWSKEHPLKTRQSVLLEQWPNCMMNEDGIVKICPRNLDRMYVCDFSNSVDCTDCRHKFWMQEVE